MQFSVGVEYALHCLLYLVDPPKNVTIGVKEMALYQGISESYLSKVFTKLKKSGIVHAIPGVKGGYKLAKPADAISFWAVIEAVEGSNDFFQCAEIRQREILLNPNDLPPAYTSCPCLIKTVMLDAEQQMKQYLQAKTIGWLSKEVGKKVPKEHLEATEAWFYNQK